MTQHTVNHILVVIPNVPALASWLAPYIFILLIMSLQNGWTVQHNVCFSTQCTHVKYIVFGMLVGLTSNELNCSYNKYSISFNTTHNKYLRGQLPTLLGPGTVTCSINVVCRNKLRGQLTHPAWAWHSQFSY